MTTPTPALEIIPKSPADVAKAIAYSVVAIATALIPVTSDGKVTNPELLILAVAVIGLLGVYWFRGTTFKVLVTFLVALVQAAALFITEATPDFGEVTATQWLVVLVTAAAAIGVGIVPNGGQGALQRDGRHELGGKPHMSETLSQTSLPTRPPLGGSGVSRPSDISHHRSIGFLMHDD